MDNAVEPISKAPNPDYKQDREAHIDYLLMLEK